jgi:hypothetical protein
MAECWRFWCPLSMHFLKTRKVASWSMKMVPVPSVNTVYCWICLKILLVIYNKVHERGKISNLMDRFLHEFLDLTTAIILTVLFCKINIILLSGELLQNYIPYFIMEWKYADNSRQVSCRMPPGIAGVISVNSFHTASFRPSVDHYSNMDTCSSRTHNTHFCLMRSTTLCVPFHWRW